MLDAEVEQVNGRGVGELQRIVGDKSRLNALTLWQESRCEPRDDANQKAQEGADERRFLQRAFYRDPCDYRQQRSREDDAIGKQRYWVVGREEVMGLPAGQSSSVAVLLAVVQE
jgi:hypothetical protein